MHISNIFGDNELDQNRTHKKYLLVRQEGGRKVQRNMDHYNLDMIIALGYRVQSPGCYAFQAMGCRDGSRVHPERIYYGWWKRA